MSGVERPLIAVAVVAVALVVAWVVQRRRPEAPTGGRWSVPGQLDRADFPARGTPRLVAGAGGARGPPRGRPRRYAIDAVPLLVLADAEGVVRASFVGPPSATDLWA